MMGRLTTNKDASDMSMTQLAHNACYVKDGKARYRDYDMDIDARELARKLLKDYAAGDDAFTDDEDFDEHMVECLMHGTNDIEGLIAMFYRNLWAMAEIHEWLRRYEDLGEQGRLVELPCSVGDRIYVIDTEKGPENKEIELHDIDNIAILNDGSILLKEDAYDGIICELENIVTDKLYLGIYRCFLSVEEAETYLEGRMEKC